MPAVKLEEGPYRFFFFVSDRDEPRHVHVERDRQRAKFWLEPVRVEWNRGFSAVEIARVQKIIERHRERLIEEWNDKFIQ